MTAKASKRFGNIKTLMVINILWVFICIYAYFIITPTDFYIAAGCVGIVMGGIQALSRSTYSKFIPETTDTASFFSFYDVAEKFGIVIGTFLYGFIAQFTGSMRNATIFLGLFFLSGLFLLTRVNKKHLTFLPGYDCRSFFDVILSLANISGTRRFTIYYCCISAIMNISGTRYPCF